MDIALPAAAAFANAAVHERIGPSPCFGGAGAVGAFVRLLEESIGKGILLPLREGEQRRSDRQRAFVEFENMTATAMVHQDCKSASAPGARRRSEEHTSELQSLMRISYAVFCLKKK